MTPTATYIAAENCLQLLPTMEKPGLPPDQTKYDSLQEWREDTWNWSLKHSAYTKAVNECPRIPCDPSCKGLWQDQQKVVVGKDYEVRFMQCPECWLLVESFNCQECKHVAFPLVPAGEPDMPNLILTAFQNEPVTFLLSNALRHLTQDQQRQLCNALQERLPTPASIEDEAERLYPYPERALADERHYINKQRSAHIFCARQYTGEIEKLRAELEQSLLLYNNQTATIMKLQAIKEEHDFRNKPLM